MPARSEDAGSRQRLDIGPVRRDLHLPHHLELPGVVVEAIEGDQAAWGQALQVGEAQRDGDVEVGGAVCLDRDDEGRVQALGQGTREAIGRNGSNPHLPAPRSVVGIEAVGGDDHLGHRKLWALGDHAGGEADRGLGAFAHCLERARLDQGQVDVSDRGLLAPHCSPSLADEGVVGTGVDRGGRGSPVDMDEEPP